MSLCRVFYNICLKMKIIVEEKIISFEIKIMIRIQSESKPYLTPILIASQYFGKVEQNLSRGKLGYIRRFFIDRANEVLYERKVRGELLGCFLHCTLEWFRPYMFLIYAQS